MKAILLLSLFIELVYFRATAATPGWTPNSTVTGIAVVRDGGFNVRLNPPLSGCTSQSGYGSTYASIYTWHPGLKLIKADVLTAYITGNPIALYLSDNNCTVTESVLGGF